MHREEEIRKALEFSQKSLQELENYKTSYTEQDFPTDKTLQNITDYYLKKNAGYELFAKFLLGTEEDFENNRVRDLEAIHMIDLRFKNPTVLEFGCGFGTATERLAQKGWEVDYVDFPGLMLDFTEFRTQGMNAHKIETQNMKWDKKYDIIVCKHVIEHMPNPGQLLQNLIDSLNHYGVLYLVYPDVWDEPEKNPEHIGKDEFRKQITTILRNSGFSLLSLDPPLWQKSIPEKNEIKITYTVGQISLSTDFTNRDKEKIIYALEMAKHLMLNKKD